MINTEELYNEFTDVQKAQMKLMLALNSKCRPPKEPVSVDMKFMEALAKAEENLKNKNALTWHL